MEEILMSANGVNGQIELLPDKIRIKRKGFLSVMTQGVKGDKDILISKITSIQFKKATWATNGYIQFAFSGGKEAKGGLLEATKDENTVMFNSFQQEAFEAMKEAIDKAMAAAAKPSSPASYLEELEKLASLRDRQIISDEEFQLKKKQLLGL